MPRNVQEAAGRPALDIRWSLDYVKNGERGPNGDYTEHVVGKRKHI